MNSWQDLYIYVVINNSRPYAYVLDHVSFLQFVKWCRYNYGSLPNISFWEPLSEPLFNELLEDNTLSIPLLREEDIPQ